MSQEQGNTHEHNPAHEHEDDDVQLEDEDVVEVVEDDGQGGEFMDDDDDNAQYDGEIIIGGPGPGEEDMMMDDIVHEDNSWGASALHQEQKSIFAISLHPSFPNPPLAISGGEDDLAYIFSPLPSSSSSSAPSPAINADTFAAIPLTGHTDSVVAAEWSFDGEMVATGGMDGRVRVWRHVARAGSGEVDNWHTWEFITSLETGSEVQWVKWHPKGNVLSAGCEDSSVWLWQLPSGNTMTVLYSHTMPCTVGVFPPPAGRQILTASLDSTLILWNPTTSAPIFKTSIFSPPNAPDLDPAEVGITALAVSPNGQLAAVGGASGGIKLVSLPKGEVVGKLDGHAEGESVEALEFIDVLGGAAGGKGLVLVSGATDGRAIVWDVNTGKIRSEQKHDEPITSLAAHPAPLLHLITSASADRTLRTWDVRQGNLVAEHKGHASVVNGVAVAPAPEGEASPYDLTKAHVVVSAGDEGASLIWKL